MAADPVNQDMILGELRGQVRELVHSVNNLNGKFDGLTREVIALGPLAADIAEIKGRLAKLEEIKNEHTGGYRVVAAILASPIVMWLVMMAGIVWAIVSGKLKP